MCCRAQTKNENPSSPNPYPLAPNPYFQDSTTQSFSGHDNIVTLRGVDVTPERL